MRLQISDRVIQVIAIVIIFLTCFSAEAKTYYVSGSGSDKNNGLNEAQAFRNIQTAANLTNPGDTVLVMDGTYTAMTPYWNNAVLAISRSGTLKDPITFAAAPNTHPIISIFKNVKVWSAVSITGSYINFEGFEIVGNAQNVTLAQANATYLQEEVAFQKTKAVPGDSATNSNCLSTQGAIHISIKKNLIHDCSAAGIGVEQYDYVDIESNVVFNSAWWTLYDTSGISIHRTINSDNYTGYKNLIINNISHDNGNTQPYYNFANGGGIPTDGNGIIVDQNQNTNDGKPYVGRTLILGNIVYNNGGSGMHAFQSAHVDMFDNTAYMNNNCPVTGSTCGNINEGQIFGSESNDMNIYNNIMYAPMGKWAYSQWNDTNVSEDHNIMYDLGGKVLIKNHVLSPHDLMADPQFSSVQLISASSALPAVDAYDVANPLVPTWAFRLNKASPAFNQGTRTLDNGTPIPVNTLDGNLAPIPVIGALSDPSSH